MMYKGLIEGESDFPKSIQEKKYEFMSAILHSAVKNIDRGYISQDVIKKSITSLVVGGLLGRESLKETKEKFKKKNGIDPPSLIVFSPTQKCNLKCTGCYAASSAECSATLPFETVEKVVDEVYNVFGSRFMTISGGEPFLYKNKGKTLLDIWEKYPEMYFLVYTNGTLITKEIAKKLAELGNVTPAISVEGLEKETDERRGKGIHKQILKAFANLREAGVPFGISVTSTNKNADLLLKDEFYEYYVEKEGATYIWQFQLMPVGRARDIKELMLTPEQRVKLYHKWKDLLVNKKYAIADFWNSGLLSSGCLAYGRGGGYLYIDWDGKIMPCVFVPYYVYNILDLHKKGKGVTDALFSDFFKRGRKWQKDYCLDNPKNPHCNWLMPCSIRDHYDNFLKNIITPNAKPENEDAEIALKSKKYKKMLKEFDEKLEKLTKNLSKKEFGK